MISYFLFSNFLFLIFMVDIFLKVWDTFSVMSDNIKSFGGMLLRKAWKAEWEKLPQPKMTWETFKRMKQQKKL